METKVVPNESKQTQCLLQKTNNKRNECYELRQHCTTLSKLEHPKKTTFPKKTKTDGFT